jgi:hypothetical protein
MNHTALAKQFEGECIRQVPSTYDVQSIELLAKLREFPDRGLHGTFKGERE